MKRSHHFGNLELLEDSPKKSSRRISLELSAKESSWNLKPDFFFQSLDEFNDYEGSRNIWGIDLIQGNNLESGNDKKKNCQKEYSSVSQSTRDNIIGFNFLIEACFSVDSSENFWHQYSKRQRQLSEVCTSAS
mmetsp:Transcript_18252/g.18319  ORF Transcript_18252/g.18319 Transcript_18252/m.18319 type:complete len:133 (+) Transcript_18252:126-524(+)